MKVGSGVAYSEAWRYLLILVGRVEHFLHVRFLFRTSIRTSFILSLVPTLVGPIASLGNGTHLHQGISSRQVNAKTFRARRASSLDGEMETN